MDDVALRGRLPEEIVLQVQPDHLSSIELAILVVASQLDEALSGVISQIGSKDQILSHPFLHQIVIKERTSWLAIKVLVPGEPHDPSSRGDTLLLRNEEEIEVRNSESQILIKVEVV